ncbi:hypothetical protein ACFOLF_27645 [Paenibacillus sepulcri]|uniref:Transposase n=1 Tax=Paenibacillus sepulcri TaxID=359917 RepID=A0ABS7CCC1_9BACL|nr:hypothetical protein [Paenibacillus sepulcri]
MVILIPVGLVIGGCLLYGLSEWKRGLEKTIDAIALVAYMGFFSLTAASAVRTYLDDTVFMTQVHEFLQDPVFHACGAYLGPYGLSLLIQKLLRR